MGRRTPSEIGKACLFLGLAVALAGCQAIKAGTTRATSDLSALQSKTPSGTYVNDSDHTSLVFKVRHFNFSTFVGRFDKVDATLHWNLAEPTASTLTATVDTSSVDTRLDAVNDALKTLFGAAANPQARFVSTQISQTGANTGEVRGDLTIDGVTHPITLEVTFNGGDVNGLTGKPTLGFSATADINRSSWNLGKWFPVVGDEVRLEIETEFVKAD